MARGKDTNAGRRRRTLMNRFYWTGGEHPISYIIGLIGFWGFSIGFWVTGTMATGDDRLASFSMAIMFTIIALIISLVPLAAREDTAKMYAAEYGYDPRERRK